VTIIQAVAPITLKTVGETAAVNIGCYPVNNQVAERVRPEMDGCITAEKGKLVVEIRPDGTLQGGNSIAVSLVLALVQ
jgi:hypothetical protein